MISNKKVSVTFLKVVILCHQVQVNYHGSHPCLCIIFQVCVGGLQPFLNETFWFTASLRLNRFYPRVIKTTACDRGHG